MPHGCAAYGCSNEGNTQARSRGITFHCFPKDIRRKREWEHAVRIKGFVAAKWSRLCSDHFKAEDFDRTGQTVRLRDGVKPSVFNFPAHLQKKVKLRTTRTARKAEEILPVAKPAQIRKATPDPQPDVDHSYALPTCPAALKARLSKALATVELLQRRERNSLIRERRTRKHMQALILDLREKNRINEELKKSLELYSDLPVDLARKKEPSVHRKRASTSSSSSCVATVTKLS